MATATATTTVRNIHFSLWVDSAARRLDSVSAVRLDDRVLFSGAANAILPTGNRRSRIGSAGMALRMASSKTVDCSDIVSWLVMEYFHPTAGKKFHPELEYFCRRVVGHIEWVGMTNPFDSLPIRRAVVVFGGSDSGGGAGVQADLKMLHKLNVHGLSVVTAITAQNPREVLAIQSVPPGMVRTQWLAVQTAFPIGAIKTGMLATEGIVRELVRIRRETPGISMVVDPVMVSTSGRLLLDERGIRRMEAELLPMATLVTPNLAECRHWLGDVSTTRKDLEQAAVELARRWGVNVLVKGGHAGSALAMDVCATRYGSTVWHVGKRIPGIKTHGTGCTFASAIAGHLARELSLTGAVAAAKRNITSAIQRSHRVGVHTVLGW